MTRATLKTIHNDIVAIKQLVNFAVGRKMIRENPLSELKLSVPRRTPQPFWTRDQVDLILNATSPRYRALFYFLADTGTRIGEARWLTWDDADLTNGLVYIRPKEGWQPKSGDQRVVPLSAGLCRVLSELPRSSQWVFTAPLSRRFPTAGRQISDRRALAHLKVVLKNLALPGHLHTFRHSFISLALTSGVAEPIVRAWVGHVDHEIIRHYTHVADQQSRRAINQILPAEAASHGGDACHEAGSLRAQNVHRKAD